MNKTKSGNALRASVHAGTEFAPEVRAFVAEHSLAMLYHQPKWLALIARMTGATLYHLVVRDAEDRVRAWAPLFLKEGPLGIVANSSPYFGSHGGILATGDAEFDAAAAGLDRFLREERAVCANIIEPLFEVRSSRYRQSLPFVMGDERYGQYRLLSGFEDREKLFADVSGLVRNNLKRRAWRENVKVERDETANAMAWIRDLHLAEMQNKAGGNPKSPAFFEAVADIFKAGSEWRIYAGRINECRVAALLVICWREYVEYITPVFDVAARAYQPLTAVVFEAMHECAREGFRWWNFGGTWPSQTSLKDYKDSWGCQNRVYRYHVLDYGRLGELARPERKAQLLAFYPGFYIFPFNAAAESRSILAGSGLKH